MGLWQYIARRLALAVLILVIVSIATFLLAHAVPGDPIDAIIGQRQGDNPALRAALEHRWGLDKPLPLQYVYYVWNMFHGDLGTSLVTQDPVASDLRTYVPGTMELAFAAMCYALLVGIPLGIVAALRQDRWPDNVSRFFALIGTSVPVFWLGLIFLYVFFYKLRWLPGPGRLDVGLTPPPRVTGMVTVDSLIAGNWADFFSVVKHIIMPAICLGSYAMGIIARMLRSSLVAAMGDDYVRTARAKGVKEANVVVGHALRNALIPTVTIIGLTFASLLAGAVLTETIFSWPGIGRYAVQAAEGLDYPALLGVTLIVAVAYVTVNLIVDIIYGVLDPRIRVG